MVLTYVMWENFPKLVVFDLDGTLVESEALASRAFALAEQDAGLPHEAEAFHLLIGQRADVGLARLENHYGDIELAKKVFDGMNDHFDRLVEEGELEAKPGAADVLAWWVSQGVPLAVATSTHTPFARKRLATLDLLDYFETVVGGDAVKQPKPAPDAYLLACERLGIDPSDAWAVEDSPTGFVSAVTAGVFTILIPDTIEVSQELRSQAGAIFDSLQAWHKNLLSSQNQLLAKGSLS